MFSVEQLRAIKSETLSSLFCKTLTDEDFTVSHKFPFIQLGRSFKGKCWGCGKVGHSRDQCPEANELGDEGETGEAKEEVNNVTGSLEDDEALQAGFEVKQSRSAESNTNKASATNTTNNKPNNNRANSNNADTVTSSSNVSVVEGRDSV